MAQGRVFDLESIRTDGWFERIGEGIGSFQALCDIIGARFFAFAMITGARITALTVDRRNPEATLVDFVVGVPENEATDADTQRLTLADFRRRLVLALVHDEPPGPAPERTTDIEALQLHIGVRYLLLAPLYGYSLVELSHDGESSRIGVVHDGLEESYPLTDFRMRLRTHVRQELDRVSRAAGRGAIDLSKVTEAREAAERGDHATVIQLLGAWQAPLSIFLRTPEGQMLAPETRTTISRGLGILGSSCIALGEKAKGEEVLRLAVQYASDGPAAPEMYERLGEAMLSDDRPGEAIAPLRRALRLGADGTAVWPALGAAFAARGRWLAALTALRRARNLGVSTEALHGAQSEAEAALGQPLSTYRERVKK